MIDLARAAQDQAHHYKNQRDALQHQLDQARGDNARLRAVNAVLLRIFADALGHTQAETTPTERADPCAPAPASTAATADTAAANTAAADDRHGDLRVRRA